MVQAALHWARQNSSVVLVLGGALAPFGPKGQLQLTQRLLIACTAVGSFPLLGRLRHLHVLPLLRGGPGGGAAAKSVHSELFCEIGKSRALLTTTHHYLLAPQPEGKKGPAGGGGSTYGASERHPAYYSEEQLYDLKADPDEKSDLVAKLNAAAAGGAAPTDPAWVVLGNLRSRLRGLLSNASARCFADGPW